MRFDFWEIAVDKVLRIDEKEKKADMHLPIRVATFGAAMAFCGIFLVILAIIASAAAMMFLAILSILIAVFAFLSYKFQRIHILSDEEFEYSTFFGKKKIYKFEHVRAVRVNADSRTLIFSNGRINIESNAILSERLRLLFNKELARIQRENEERKRRLNTHKAAKAKKLAELTRARNASSTHTRPQVAPDASNTANAKNETSPTPQAVPPTSTTSKCPEAPPTDTQGNS